MNYINNKYEQYYDRNGFKYIVEVGARDALDSISLANHFPNAQVYSYEANPEQCSICQNNIANSIVADRIVFNNYGLGHEVGSFEFYPYVCNNVGCSSFLKRIDFADAQKVLPQCVAIHKLIDDMKQNNVPYIDLLCMDVQGYELNILKGCDEYIRKIKYVIMEVPNSVINLQFLPKDTYSKYIGAPDPHIIIDYMKSIGFEEVVRIAENAIEDNVMYRNTNFIC